jgi:hypothetical protein
MPKPEIYLSYAWGDDAEVGESRQKIADDLYETLAKDHRIAIIRDKARLKYGDSISEFMLRIAKAKTIVLIISDKYLRSPYCMFELLQIFRRSNSDLNEMKKKIFPLILPDAKLFLPEHRLNYAQHWKQKKEDLIQQIAGLDLTGALGFGESLQIYEDISANIEKLLFLLGDIYSLNTQKIAPDNFEETIKLIVGQTMTAATGDKDAGDEYSFNEIFIRRLIELMAAKNSVAQRILNNVKDLPEWEKDEAIVQKVKGFISSSFPGIINVQLNKLWAIGNDKHQKDYVDNSVLLAKRTIQLLCFAFLSRLWDYKSKVPLPLEKKDKEIIGDFFERIIEPGLDKYLDLLQTLVRIFTNYPGYSPFPELTDLETALTPGSEFGQACKTLQSIRKEAEHSGYTPDIFQRTESALAVFLSSLTLLSGYKMVSIKAIGYYAARNTTPHYLHNYTALEEKNAEKANLDMVKYFTIPGHADAILLFKEDYRDGLNLFPFMVDLNALDLEKIESNILFYSAKDGFNDNSLNYCFSAGDKTKSIAAGDAIQIALKDGSMIDIEGQKQLKRLTMIMQFEEAKKIILGGNTPAALVHM